MEYTFPVGSILCFNAKKGGWFSSAQRLFTRQPYTHSAVVMPPVVGIQSYLGADLTVDIQPISKFVDDQTMDFQVWEWVGVTPERTNLALTTTYVRHAGQTYGFWQILWFVYRWFCEQVLRKDVRKQHNWFPNNPICSEVTWWTCKYMVGDNWTLLNILNEWRPDTFHSGDQADVMRRFEQLGAVRKVCERWTYK